MNKPFFMVFLEGGNTPIYQHPTLESAEAEAERLCKLHKRKAVVLCSIKSIELVEVVKTDLRPQGDDLPF